MHDRFCVQPFCMSVTRLAVGPSAVQYNSLSPMRSLDTEVPGVTVTISMEAGLQVICTAKPKKAACLG